jgi:transcriptional regulator with XRE-family HTH domain
MRETIPNVQLTAYREGQDWTRADMANRLNQTPAAVRNRLACDEERLRRWERGEVLGLTRTTAKLLRN